MSLICLIIVYYMNYQGISSLSFLQPQYHEREKAIITNKNNNNKVSILSIFEASIFVNQ